MSKRKLQNEGHSSEKKAKFSHWSLGLLESVESPENLIQEDSFTYVIKDKFPKAKHHYLVISKQDISSVSKVTKNNLELLKHMERAADKLVKTISDDKYKFKIGYHSQPSMARLHLHVISDDMNSACLKNKKHWNSFTTDFFIPSGKIIKSLEKDGKILLPSDQQCKKFLTQDLKCNKCTYAPKNMPDLKKHILSHL